MCLWKCIFYNVLCSMLFGLWSGFAISEVIELGEASLFGKKDQPEAVLFVSKAPTKDSVLIKSVKVSPKIVESIDDKIFSVGMTE